MPSTSTSSIVMFSYEWVMSDPTALALFENYLREHQNIESLQCVLQLRTLQSDIQKLLKRIRRGQVKLHDFVDDSTSYSFLNFHGTKEQQHASPDSKKKHSNIKLLFQSTTSDEESTFTGSRDSFNGVSRKPCIGMLKIILTQAQDLSLTFLSVNSPKELNLPQQERYKICKAVTSFWRRFAKRCGLDENALNVLNSGFPIPHSPPLHGKGVSPRPLSTCSTNSSTSEESMSFAGQMEEPIEEFPNHLQSFEEELQTLESFLHVQIKSESFRDFSQSEQLFTVVQQIKPTKEQLKELKRNYRQSISASRIQEYIEDLVVKEDGKPCTLREVNKLLSWTVEDVVHWLQQSCLNELEPLIRRKNIDGEKLVRLEDDLSLINIQDLELRKRFEYEVDELLVSHGFDPLPETDYLEIVSRRKSVECEHVQKNYIDLSTDTFLIKCVLKNTDKCKELQFHYNQLVNYFSMIRAIKESFQISGEQHVDISFESAENSVNLSPSNILNVFKKDLLASVRDLVSHQSSISNDVNQFQPSPRNLREKKIVINVP
ncbi:hypothetical protein C9374_007329 [Naegleria lovaniensis]|uniref:SAM domain-containing protein n=1 Tax=Naegleria lovaniensis TaxID=51637 RepID=A0AA88GLX5_NAELO|nr:uncharacterized protein C9374_007329 [Naegleria lovaniensis]KAG2379190.1 hypothetical protein C9374_007329 [Naegleria lovaniensis]